MSPGDWIKRRRKELDLSQEALGKLAACTVFSVRRIEYGDLKPSRELALTLAKALTIPPHLHETFVGFVRGTIRQFAITKPIVHYEPAVMLSEHAFLPAPLTSLIGRDREVSAGRALLEKPGVRLVTLYGPPGTGKTRLSIEIAQSMKHQFVDGVVFVALASVSEVEQVPDVIAHGLGIKDSARDAQLSGSLHLLRDYLRDRSLLLVLDNFEQVVGAGIQIAELLQTAPKTKIIVSSRELLQVYGEYPFAVPALGLPDAEHPPPLEALSGYSAVELFVERAQAIQPDFRLTAANALHVVRICGLVDGLPLALEMAAAQLRRMPVRQLVDQLQSHLANLGIVARNFTPRQQSLRGAIDWSYNLLTAQEQRAFKLISVFAGGFDEAAALAVLLPAESPAPDSNGQAVETLYSLVNKSLLVMAPDEYADLPGIGRSDHWFGMLETIREYGREKLALDDEQSITHVRHATYFMALLYHANEQLYSRTHARWVARLQRDLDNINSSFAYLAAHDRAQALEFAAAASRFHYVRGAWRLEKRWLDESLKRAPAASTPRLQSVRATALARASFISTQLGLLDEAADLAQQALDLAKQCGDDAVVMDALRYRGIVNAARQQFDVAIQSSLESIAVAERIGLAVYAGQAHQNIGRIYLDQNQFDRAKHHFDMSLALRRAHNDYLGESQSLSALGELAYRKSDYVTAEHLLLRCCSYNEILENDAA